VEDLHIRNNVYAFCKMTNPFQCRSKLDECFVETDELKYFYPHEKGQDGHHIHINNVPEAKNIQTLIGQFDLGFGCDGYYFKSVPDIVH